MRFIVATVLLAGLHSSFAQSWTAASVLTQNGDSVRGEILFKDWNVSPSVIEFRTQRGTINQSDILAFKIYQGNRSFERVNIPLRYYREITGPSDSPVGKEVTTDVFAEVIYANTLVRLYSLGDEEKTERFLCARKVNRWWS